MAELSAGAHRYVGPVVISDDLTVFDVTRDAVLTRQASIDPTATGRVT